MAATYALSRGIYAGSKIYLSPYIRGQYDKDCRYLSFDGIFLCNQVVDQRQEPPMLTEFVRYSISNCHTEVL